MTRIYACPHCEGVLNPGNRIILRAQHKAARGLVLLSPKPGNYDVVLPAGFSVKAKDTVDFGCPLCGHDLTSKRDPKFAEVAFHKGEKGGLVAFSRVFGQHSTYFVTEKKVKSYGKHAEPEPVNFFGAGPED
ncbi:MAG TPA: hypothetical protein VGK67_33325 [Myxococcales bacterium]|jgi:hypothetical protein